MFTEDRNSDRNGLERIDSAIDNFPPTSVAKSGIRN